MYSVAQKGMLLFFLKHYIIINVITIVINNNKKIVGHYYYYYCCYLIITRVAVRDDVISSLIISPGMTPEVLQFKYTAFFLGSRPGKIVGHQY